MLRHDPFDLEPAHHLGPQPADAVAAHVAAVERRHQRNVRIEIFHRRGGDLRVDHRRAQVAREQDARHRIVELEVALRVQEVRRHRQQVRLPDRDRHAGVGDRQDAAVGLAHVAEVRQEAFPHARDQDVAVRAREPAPGRGDDVRVRVRGQHIVELLGREVLVHRQVQRVVRHVAARVDQRAVAMVDDEELVGLDRLVVVVVDQVRKHQAGMLRCFVEGGDHGRGAGWQAAMVAQGGMPRLDPCQFGCGACEGLPTPVQRPAPGPA